MLCVPFVANKRSAVEPPIQKRRLSFATLTCRQWQTLRSEGARETVKRRQSDKSDWSDKSDKSDKSDRL